jgi:hypothetical protein
MLTQEKERTGGWKKYTLKGLIIFTLHQILYYGDQIKQDKMNGAYGTQGGEVKCI